MKTTAKHFTAYRNIGLVQLSATQAQSMRFIPGGPALEKGELVVSESTAGGVVGSLTALNNSGQYILLTDADVLTGARQNRIVNKSVLLSPYSKTNIDVSCVERLRWHYTSANFGNSGIVADPAIRRDKASTFRKMNNEDEPAGTQAKVWSHISNKLHIENFANETESYSDYMKQSMETRAEAFPECNIENGCNGLAVIADGNVISIDIYGTEDLYAHYFPMLRDSAFNMASVSRKTKPADINEAYFRALDMVDRFELLPRQNEELYKGTGSLRRSEDEHITGFELLLNNQPVHLAIFAK